MSAINEQQIFRDFDTISYRYDIRSAVKELQKKRKAKMRKVKIKNISFMSFKERIKRKIKHQIKEKMKLILWIGVMIFCLYLLVNTMIVLNSSSWEEFWQIFEELFMNGMKER